MAHSKLYTATRERALAQTLYSWSKTDINLTRFGFSDGPTRRRVINDLLAEGLIIKVADGMPIPLGGDEGSDREATYRVVGRSSYETRQEMMDRKREELRREGKI
jgi:hypothetical protein